MLLIKSQIGHEICDFFFAIQQRFSHLLPAINLQPEECHMWMKADKGEEGCKN